MTYLLLTAQLVTAVALTLARGRRPRCRCFGAAGAPLRPALVARNLALAALAGAGAAAATGPADPTTLAAAPLAVGAIVATIALAAVASFDDLVEIVAPSDHT